MHHTRNDDICIYLENGKGILEINLYQTKILSDCLGENWGFVQKSSLEMELQVLKWPILN